MLFPEPGTASGVQWAWLAPALSASAFFAVVLLGRFIPRNRAFLSILAIAAGFGVFWYVLKEFLSSGGGEFSVKWFTVGDITVSWGIVVDELSVVMLGLVTFVALAVQVYSLGYMKGEARFGWYFAVHSLFAAAMLTVVLTDNFLLLYMAWELVGVCSYLLIGFWYERRSAAEAAKKAFITTRIGDVGLLIGIIMLFKATGGHFDYSTIVHVAEEGGIASGTLTVAMLLIFLGAMGKSAQFPLHVWLPDAMEGPAPVSALIHAATMVVAGVYLVARLFPLFLLAPTALLVVAIIGLITALLTASMALVMTDLKRVLAYSTISHLGFMMLALGSGGFTAGMFHLLTHAFAKALLFLGAGSIAHGSGKTDIREMGGLWRRMPVTAVAFGIGVLALGGIPPLSGFFSKDEVLVAVLSGRGPVFFVLTLAAALMSAMYMARLLFLVVLGNLKKENEHAHESPWVMKLPLVALAILALTAGFLAPGWTSDYKGFGAFLFHEEPEAYHINGLVMGLSLALAFGGFALGWALYSRGLLSADRIRERFAWLHRLLVNKYYIDALYQWVINRIVLVLGRFIALFDRVVINDTGVNGTGRSVLLSGIRLRYLETGKVYNYALGMVVGVVVVALIWWLGLPNV
ncbi:MAG: nuoL [Dehalococcoidia bacterium]|nr:nuoL [Dehalococcoidia bacterium]